MTMTQHPDPLFDMTPAAKLVYHVLQEADRPLHQQAIAARAPLPDRTTRDALDRLVDAGLVDEEWDLGDARKRRYSISQ